MRSQAATVAEYLAELPEDRRHIVQAVREVILQNLHRDYEDDCKVPREARLSLRCPEKK